MGERKYSGCQGARELSNGFDFSPEEIKRRIHQTLMLRTQKLWNVCPESQASEQMLCSCWAPVEPQSQNQHQQKLHLTDAVETAVPTQVENHLRFLSQKTLMIWRWSAGRTLSGSLLSCGQKTIYFFPKNCKQIGSTMVTNKMLTTNMQVSSFPSIRSCLLLNVTLISILNNLSCSFHIQKYQHPFGLLSSIR